ncbi:hypothetical protein GCM10009532_20660 [Microbacterium aurantiacum]
MPVAHLLDCIRSEDAGGVHRAPIDLIPTQFRHRAAFLKEPRPDVVDPREHFREEMEDSALGARVVLSIAKGYAPPVMRALV